MCPKFEKGKIIICNGLEVRIIEVVGEIDINGEKMIEYECEFLVNNKKFRQFEEFLIERMGKK